MKAGYTIQHIEFNSQRLNAIMVNNYNIHNEVVLFKINLRHLGLAKDKNTIGVFQPKGTKTKRENKKL